MSTLPTRSFPVVLSAPSGAGKTSIARSLVELSKEFVFSVSATTRPRREGEEDGVHYIFLTAERFSEMQEAGELVESAEVHGHMYGTPKSEVQYAEELGQHVVMDIDVQGARQVRAALPEAMLIFILPPSMAELRTRLAKRGTEDPGEMARRLGTARLELSAIGDFDYVVVNRDLKETVTEVAALVRAESYRIERSSDLGAEVSRLDREIESVLTSEFADLES